MSVNAPTQFEIFGIRIQGRSLTELMRWVFDASQPSPKWIITANPEILLEARRNSAYANVLRQADEVCVDGFGLWLILRLKGQRTERVTGVSLAERLIQEVALRGWKLGMIGGDSGIAERAANKWKVTYPNLRVVVEVGGKIQPDGAADASEEEAVHRLVLEAPDVLLVAFGGGSKQESWIARRIGDFPSLKIIVGVGGAFDFWSGRLSRAPQILQMLGLEWLWRLCQEPRRIGRIFRATIVFPLTIFWDSLCRK